MLAFTYDMLPSRVVFGVGCLDKLPEEIERLGASRALVLSTPEQREAGQQMVDRLGARVFQAVAARMIHCPAWWTLDRACFSSGATNRGAHSVSCRY